MLSLKELHKAVGGTLVVAGKNSPTQTSTNVPQDLVEFGFKTEGKNKWTTYVNGGDHVVKAKKIDEGLYRLAFMTRDGQTITYANYKGNGIKKFINLAEKISKELGTFFMFDANSYAGE